MNRLRYRGHWHLLRGRLRAQWARWRGNRLQLADAQIEQLRGRLQRRHRSGSVARP